jgi:hypothetical protein
VADVARDGRNLARELEDVREQQRAISGVIRVVARSVGLQPIVDEVAEACCDRADERAYQPVWAVS